MILLCIIAYHQNMSIILTGKNCCFNGFNSYRTIYPRSRVTICDVTLLVKISILVAQIGSCTIHLFPLRPLRLCGEFSYRRDTESVEKRLLKKPLLVTTICTLRQIPWLRIFFSPARHIINMVAMFSFGCANSPSKSWHVICILYI